MVKDITFVTDEHKKFYYNHQSIVSIGPEYEAVVYILGINPVCREHFFEIYDNKKHCFILESICEPWQTGSSRSITRIAFNLYSWSILPADEPEDYTPLRLFRNLGNEQKQGVLLAIKYFF